MILFSPSHVPKLPKGWLARIRTAVERGTFSPSAVAVAHEAGVDVKDLLAKFVDPDDSGAAAGEAFAVGLRFPLLPYLVAFANSSAETPRHLCLLGDQGAGKTSVLAVLALINGVEPHRKTCPLRYLKLDRATV